MVTTAAQRISASNLHERLAMTGPDDEIKELSDTFDGLLGRLERAFDAQRQFVANASHELRTPLARQRAFIEVALDDAGRTVDSRRGSQRRRAGDCVSAPGSPRRPPWAMPAWPSGLPSTWWPTLSCTTSPVAGSKSRPGCRAAMLYCRLQIAVQ